MSGNKNWVVNHQITDLLEGLGATEDHKAVVKFLEESGLYRSVATAVHAAIVEYGVVKRERMKAAK